jgi:hypothetical protein
MPRGIKPYECSECEEIYDNRENPCSEWEGKIVCPHCYDELNTEEMEAMHRWNEIGEAYQ